MKIFENFENFGKNVLPSDPPHSSHLEKKIDFDFDNFHFSLYMFLFPSSLVCLIVMDLENVGTKIFDFFFRFQF